MKTFVRFLAAIMCLLLAIAAFSFGVPIGGVAFVILGIALEGLFWHGILGKRKLT